MNITIGQKEFFPGIGAVHYEGKDSDNPLAFKWYDENRVVRDRTMRAFSFCRGLLAFFL